MFAIQNEIANSVATALREGLTGSTTRLTMDRPVTRVSRIGKRPVRLLVRGRMRSARP